MSAICSCKYPQVEVTQGNNRVCRRCGAWYMPEHGSNPVIPEPSKQRSAMLDSLMKKRRKK